MLSKHHKIFRILTFIILIAGMLYASLLVTRYVSTDQALQVLIQDFGYIGVLLVSFVTGLNLLIPIPAATFVPIFTAGGMSLVSIIIFLVIGTMTANLLSYVIGWYGKKVTESHYPKIQAKIVGLYTKHQSLLPYFVFGFAAFVPLPDEIYLVPLGIIGVRIRDFIIPLLLGTILYQTLSALGVDNIFNYLLL